MDRVAGATTSSEGCDPVTSNKKTSASCMERWSIRATGIVQGVGFRPFIYRLAKRYDLKGFVGNDSQGVFVEVEGLPEQLQAFYGAIETELPPRSALESLRFQPIPVQHDQQFVIVKSRNDTEGETLVASDIATCRECVEEIFDSTDCRYHYPFTNCTNCGPRFSIIKKMPYDRAQTTMDEFHMCPDCQREYDNPENRRFHAQPNACATCGPQLELFDKDGLRILTEQPIADAANALLRGEIVAVKGIGGMHLACNPFDVRAVSRLRERKQRPDQPFALMVRDLQQAREHCELSDEEERLLQSSAAPIVLAKAKPGSQIAKEVAPRQQRLGIMLAYTPLHHLLMRKISIPLVMTSGNRSGLPMIHKNGDALTQLAGIADWFLLHNRPIHSRIDDSVTIVVNYEPMLIRRARGYAPFPLRTSESFKVPLLGTGAELKSSFCFGKGQYLYASHYIGDLKTYETFQEFKNAISHYMNLFRVSPLAVAHDLHPDYLSTRYAMELAEQSGVPVIGIQHHEAHVASCLADNGCSVDEPVIGVAFDGTGYGTDGANWGGEFFTGSLLLGFRRYAHLQYVPLPGGDQAVREPWRIAVAYLTQAFGFERAVRLDLPMMERHDLKQLTAIDKMMQKGLNSPLTSSAGRLFDAVAALVDVVGADRITYEGQAAIELEQTAGIADGERYPFELDIARVPWIISADRTIEQLVQDLKKGVSRSVIAARFHASVADMIVAVCENIREREGITAVALSGGVFQNERLLTLTIRGLENKRFRVYRHRQVPANDAGVAVGQVMLARNLSRDSL